MQARGKYIIDPSIMAAMRRDSVVLHPLPRVDEVPGGRGVPAAVQGWD